MRYVAGQAATQDRRARGLLWRGASPGALSPARRDQTQRRHDRGRSGDGRCCRPSVPVRSWRSACRLLRQRLFHGLVERIKAARKIMQMQADGAAATFVEDLKVALRLRQFEGAEGQIAVLDRHLVRMVAGESEKDAAVGASLVGLSGGMKVARSKSQTRRDVFSVAHLHPNGLQRFLMLR